MSAEFKISTETKTKIKYHWVLDNISCLGVGEEIESPYFPDTLRGIGFQLTLVFSRDEKLMITFYTFNRENTKILYEIVILDAHGICLAQENGEAKDVNSEICSLFDTNIYCDFVKEDRLTIICNISVCQSTRYEQLKNTEFSDTDF